MVSFDEDHINAQFRITNVQDEHTPFTDIVIINGLNQVVNDLCVKLGKTASLNFENEKEREKDETATATTATLKGTDPVPPTLPASTAAQDLGIDYLIYDLMETDKEGDEMNPMKRKL
ncbi:hypothetical protein PVK06_034036 [Gossypium arboreum]|uniref:Uncharacterized protein n=1 Tax=Gossypium arboreum TaxID=29729 RepID=A0ABR0NE11_GOSAR|nr:hypothetical protein PVK06_034036 [Gossypium arboreum]